MSIDVNSGSEIDLKEAKAYLQAFRSKNPNEIKALFVGKENVLKILNQQDCIGIRIYNGYDTYENRMNLVLVGVDSTGRDITEGILLDRMKPCPDYCDINSELFKIQ